MPPEKLTKGDLYERSKFKGEAQSTIGRRV